MTNLIIIQTIPDDMSIILRHFPEKVEILKSIHKEIPLSNLWAVDEILFNQLHTFVFSFLPHELRDLIMIQTIIIFLKNHMFKKATKLICLKRYYIKIFSKFMFGRKEAFADKISRSLFFIYTMHGDVMKSLNDCNAPYILNEITLKNRFKKINSCFPWDISRKSVGQYQIDIMIMEIEEPNIGVSPNHFHSFTIGSTFGDIAWAKGYFDEVSGFFKSEKFMYPIIPLIFRNQEAQIYLDLNSDWQSMNEWGHFEQFYKIIYGKTTTLLFATTTEDPNSEYYFYHF